MDKNKKHKKIKKKNRKGFLSIFKFILKIFIRKPKFIYLDGCEIKAGSIILSNHVAKTGPLVLECYLKNPPFRFWGTHEMNEGFKAVYKYQTEVFYHQKQHWNIHLARLACVVISPLTYCFYKGLNLISTFKDYRFRKTINESINTIKDNQSVVIFPEDSNQGYFDNLKSFYGGFVVLAQALYNQGIDVPIYVAYLKKKEKQFIFDKPIMFSELLKQNLSRDEIASKLCNRANELKNITFDNNILVK